MSSRVFEIILHYMEKYRKQLPLEDRNLSALQSVFLQEGYEESEIRHALQWMRTRSERDSMGKVKPNPSVRILSTEESESVSPEAYGYLLSLVSWGLIDGSDFEVILEKARLGFGAPVTLEEVQIVADGVLLFGSDKIGKPDRLFHH